MSATRYPLAWPAGWKRTAPGARVWSKFGKAVTTYGAPNPTTGQRSSWKSKGELSVADATRRLLEELGRLGVHINDVILSTNIQLRLDGLPRSGQARPDDPGVAVYFKLRKADRCLACDRYTTVEGNIAALAAHVEALRAIERYGVGTIEQAFAGYTALGAAAEVEWWLVLQVPRSAPLESIDAAYKVLARRAHPDAGGSEAEMQRLNVARDAARKEKADD